MEMKVYKRSDETSSDNCTRKMVGYRKKKKEKNDGFEHEFHFVEYG